MREAKDRVSATGEGEPAARQRSPKEKTKPGQVVKVHISGLEIMARHGVLPEEREKEQLFVFDIDLTVPAAAVDSDDIGDTVSYADICESVAGVATAGSFRLLEKLAAETADEILRGFPLVEKVKIRVSKPDAPLSRMVRDVAVSLTRKRK